MGSGPLQVIKELSKPVWIVEKQPANHCLKPCGPAIDRCIPASRTSTCTVSPAAHPVQLLIAKEMVLLQPIETSGLGISTHSGHHSPVQIIEPPGHTPKSEALMELPYGITDPCELQGSEGLRALS